MTLEENFETFYNNKLLDRVNVQMHQTLSMLMEQARSSPHLPNKEASASKRCYIVLSSHQQTWAQFLVQSAPSDPSGSLHGNAAKHQRLDTSR